jgi:hypothetical protein
MTSLDRGTRSRTHNGVFAPQVRGARSLLLAILLALALVFASSTGVAAAASPPRPPTPHVATAGPGYNQAAIDSALAAVAKIKAALNKNLHPKKHHQQRHR